MTKRILNLTNHVMTGAQLDELFSPKWGYTEVVELDPEDKALWSTMDPSNYKEVSDMILAKYEYDGVHLAGFPVMLPYVVSKYGKSVELLYAYSGRNSVEEHMPDGSVVKKNIFVHKGFFRYTD